MAKALFAKLSVKMCIEDFTNIAHAIGTWERIGKFFSGKYSSSIAVKKSVFVELLGYHIGDNLEMAWIGDFVDDLFTTIDQGLVKNGNKRLTMKTLMNAAKKFQNDFPDSELLREIKHLEQDYVLKNDEADSPEGSDDDTMDLEKMIEIFEGTRISHKKRSKITKKSNSKH
jgi:hypothetical protein